jgi:hypothetical protein
MGREGRRSRRSRRSRRMMAVRVLKVSSPGAALLGSMNMDWEGDGCQREKGGKDEKRRIKEKKRKKEKDGIGGRTGKL